MTRTIYQALPRDGRGAPIPHPDFPSTWPWPRLSLFLGVALSVTYVVFGALAWVHFPGEYSPLHDNTLSQLGNRNLNPEGATFYLVGCALSGMLAIAFFFSLAFLGRSGTRAQNWLLWLVQGLGAIGGFALFMNAIYPEDVLPPHHFWAGVLFNSFGAAMLLAPVALWRQGHANLRLIAITALGSVAVILMFVFAGTHWVEWLPVTLFLLSPGLLGLHTRELHAAHLESNASLACETPALPENRSRRG